MLIGGGVHQPFCGFLLVVVLLLSPVVCEQSYFGRRAPLVWYQFLDPMIVVVLAVELAGLSA